MGTKYPGLNKVGEFWHYSLNVNGQRSHGSTKAKDLVTAKKVLEERRKEILHGQLGFVSKIPTLTALVREWMKVHQKIHSVKHIAQVEQFTRMWILPDLGTTRIDRVSTSDILRLRNRLLEKGRSPVTVNNLLRIIRLLFGYAQRIHYIERLPFDVRPIKVQKKPRPVLSASRVHQFFECVDRHTRNEHVPVMVRVMVGLGLRESEVLGMRWEWFNPDHQTYTVGKAKGKEARVLPVPSWLWKRIHTMPKILGEWVFPAEDGHPHRTRSCKKALQTVAKELGLGNLTQHRLRATFATLHADTGTPITEIQGMLGHKSVTTTMIYVEQNLESKRRSQDALSLRLGLA